MNDTLVCKVQQLIEHQFNTWPFLKKNYEALNLVRLKQLDFSGFYLKLQFNPARIISSSACIDKESIDKRPCFLCTGNRPIEQLAVQFGGDLLILLNPYPIFQKHLTIVHKQHVPQLIQDYVVAMLDLAEELETYTIFYNGPRCGASAPDHFHFQAAPQNAMPIESQLDELLTRFGSKITDSECNTWKVDDSLRRFLVLESTNKSGIHKAFSVIYRKLQLLKYVDHEPDMNIHCSFRDKRWRLLLFPRGAHRPWQYEAIGEEKILFSPASVDFGGLLIFPIEKDFEKMNQSLISNLFSQVGISQAEFDEI